MSQHQINFSTNLKNGPGNGTQEIQETFVTTKDGDVEVKSVYVTRSKSNNNDNDLSKVRGKLASHSRNLSSHFVDATRLSDIDYSQDNKSSQNQIEIDSTDKYAKAPSSQAVKGIMKQTSSLFRNTRNSNVSNINDNSNTLTVHYAAQPVDHISDEASTIKDSTGSSDANVIKKRHRRNQSSGGSFKAVLAHRRINSIGSSIAVLQKNHYRENSEGLDILSAAADLTEDELIAAVGKNQLSLHSLRADIVSANHARNHSLIGGPIDLAINNINDGNTSSTKPLSQTPKASSNQKNFARHNRVGSLLGSLDTTGTALLMSLLPPDSNLEESSMPTASQINPSQGELKQIDFSSEDKSKLDKNVLPTPENDSLAYNIGSGYGLSPAESLNDNNLDYNSKKVSNPSPTSKNPSEGNKRVKSKAHHRTLSSFGMIAGLLPQAGLQLSQPSIESNETFTHHRPKSSNLSSSKFLINLEDSIDANIPGGSAFLQSLTDLKTSEKKPSSFSPPLVTMKPKVSIKVGNKVTPKSKTKNGTKPKRMRRKCNVEGCPNRVVQGGVCISHGAKRKTCAVEGCEKNVKKAGFCSAHGPARKRCEVVGCDRVSVQGGKCISHGARKKLCDVPGCAKQSILAGMCKKHHDEKQGLRMGKDKRIPISGLVPSNPICVMIGNNKSSQAMKNSGDKSPYSPPQHARRGSFRADNATVEAIFKIGSENGSTDPFIGSSTVVKPKSQKQKSRNHRRGISLFADETVTNTLMKNNLIL